MTGGLYIIGVGASAGGLEALTELFSNLPKTLSDRTVFIVAQHLSPTHRSMLVQILAKDSVFPVREALHGEKVDAGYIYITPPDSDIRIHAGIILLSKPQILQGPKPSVDILFTSIAEEYNQKAIGIILSGTGSDGANGIKELKNHGGIAIIQNPDTAKYDGMPISALQTGLIDYSIPPDKMGKKIEEILQRNESGSIVANEDLFLERIYAILLRRFGTNFSNYKISTIRRRIEKAKQNTKYSNLNQFIDILEGNFQRLNELYQSFLIGVTSFYRDPIAYQSLTMWTEKKISKNEYLENFRIWVPGCSTGEEAYTLAIIIQELLEKHKRFNCHLQIFATDVNEESLLIARKGVYSKENIGKLPAEYREKYFIKKEAGFEVEKNIRSKVLFSKHDVTINPPFLKIDLLSCRNLLIYLKTEVQRQVFPVFHFALKEDGFLFLGKSESVSQVEDLFDVLDSKNKVFVKRKFASNNQLKFGAFKPLGISNLTNSGRSKESSNVRSYSSRVTESIVELIQPNYIVVNSAFDIIESRGELNDFMQIPEGILNLNVTKLIRKEIQLEVKNILLQVIKEKKKISSSIKKVHLNEKKLYLKIQSKPVIKDDHEFEDLYILQFEKFDFDSELFDIVPTPNENSESWKILEIEEELTVTKEHLQTYIEEIETTNEELQSLNEELQSTNEELQSANEELETGNEELQSSNEELQTAYSEIKHINLELEAKEGMLRESNNLFNTLFENVQQGNLLLEENFNLLIINKKGKNLLSLIGMKDMGIGSNFVSFLPDTLIQKIFPLIRKAQEKNEVILEIIPIQTQEKVYYYQFCIMYIARDSSLNKGYISIGILDFTEFKDREEEIFKRDSMLVSLLSSNTSYLIRIDKNGCYTYANESFCKKFGYEQEQLIGKFYGPTVHPDDLRKCELATEKAITEPGNVISVELRKPNPRGGFFDTEWEFVTIQNSKGEFLEIQCVGRDITAFKKIQKSLEEERNHLELMLWGGRLGTWDWDVVSGKIKFNHRWLEILGYDKERTEWDYKDWVELIHPDDKEIFISALESNLSGETSFYDVEHRKKAKNGVWKWIVAVGKVIERDSKGKAKRVMGIHQDITEKKLIEAEIRKVEARNNSIVSNMKEGIVIQDLSGQIISCNSSAESILGLTFDQLIGKTSVDKEWKTIREDGSPFPGEEHPAMITLKTGKPQQGIIMGVYKPDNVLTWISVNSQLLYHPDNKTPYAVFAIFHDISDIKKAEVDLVEEKRRLDDIIEGTNSGTWEWNIHTGEFLINERWANIIGYTLEQLNPLNLENWYQLIYPEDRIKIKDLIQKHFNKEIDFFTYESRVLNKEGKWIWVVDSGKVSLRDKDSNPILMSGTRQDITERKNVAMNLQKSEELLRASMESSLDDIYLLETQFDLDGQVKDFIIKDINENARIHLGKTKTQILEKGIKELFPSEILEVFFEKFKDVTKKRLPTEEEISILSDSENSKWYNLQVVPITNGIAVYIRNITEKKNAEKEMSRLSLLAQKTSNAVIITDVNGFIIWTNKGFEKLTGYTLEECIGKKPGEFLQCEETDPETVEYIRNKINKMEPAYCEILNKSKSGNKYWINLEIQPIVDESKKLIGFMSIETDITFQKESKRKLAEQNNKLQNINKELEQFAFITSHDLQEPLNSLISCVDILKEESEKGFDEFQLKYLDFIKNLSYRMQELIRGLMIHAELGKRGEADLVDLNETLKEALADTSALIRSKKAIIEYSDLPKVTGFKTELRLLFQNLISNAIKFSKSDTIPEVKIYSEERKEDWFFIVEDNGIGMEERNFEKIFTIFQRLHNRNEYSGIGIGLSYCKKIINLHGGEIWVESLLNKGSKFYFTISKGSNK